MVVIHRMYGCYENIDGGSSAEVMVDFTGGLAESIDVNHNPPLNLFTVINKTLQRESMMQCAINVRWIYFLRFMQFMCCYNLLSTIVSYKKLSYCWETVRRENMPRIAEMDVKMTI